MDIQHFLAVNIMVISALALVGTLFQRSARLDALWLGLNASVIATGAVMLNWLPHHAGTATAVIFLPFVLGPLLLDRVIAARVAKRRMGEAARLARFASWLHPTAGARFTAATLAAQSGDTLAAQKAALQKLAEASGPDERSIIEAMVLRLEARWEDLVELLDARPETAATMPAVHVRALGETGRLDRMARVYEGHKVALHGSGFWEVQMLMMAFAGRREEVGRLLEGPLAGLDPDYKAYWGAIADLSSGAGAPASRNALIRLAEQSSSIPVRQAAARALGTLQARQRPPSLDEVASVILEEAAQRLRRLPPAESRRAAGTPITWLLLAAIAVGFGLSELRGGSQSMRTLINLGALWPPSVTEHGEWWRLATALFLHWGWLHFAVNGVMLLVLGRAVERSFGSLHMAAIYALGGLASSAFVLWLAATGNSEPAVLVGASGAIMALFGGLAGRSLVMWLRHRDMLDGRNLGMLAVVAALQVAVDLATPQVSLAAHASGIVAGAVIGALLTLKLRSAAS